MSNVDTCARLVADPAGAQVAALCWRRKGDAIQILLLTSRDTGRWVIPKGWPLIGKTPEAAAAREAWEEGGVEGSVGAVSIGIYAYMKLMPDAQVIPCVVTVYPLEVRRLAKKFPERAERRRAWVSPQEACRRVVEPDLGALLAGFDPGSAVIAPKARPGGKKRGKRALASGQA